MPEFYNRMIHRCQRLALEPWLDIASGHARARRGLRRRTLEFAAGRARRAGDGHGPEPDDDRAKPDGARTRSGIASRCRFLVQDLAQLDAGEQFDLMLGVTVLQHILDPEALRAAVQRMADHLAPGGRMVLLEAAPARVRETLRYDSVSRAAAQCLSANCSRRRDCELRAISGVDPAPFKTWLLPHLRRLPRPLAMSALALVTLLSAPVDIIFGRRAVKRSWHAVFVLERTARRRHMTISRRSVISIGVFALLGVFVALGLLVRIAPGDAGRRPPTAPR